MSDEQDDHQPPLTLTHISYTRGELEGKPCVVVYDAASDKTTVIAAKSRWYAEAMAAMDILAAASTRVPKSLQNPKTLVTARKPKLILPGSNASN